MCETLAKEALRAFAEGGGGATGGGVDKVVGAVGVGLEGTELRDFSGRQLGWPPQPVEVPVGPVFL